MRISPSAMDGLFIRSEEQGQCSISPISRKADFSQGCENPFFINFESREDVVTWHQKRHRRNHLWRFLGGASHLNPLFKDRVSLPPLRHFEAWLPCRKCATCLRRRGRLWYRRAMVETALSSRTWFATFTIAPEMRVRIEIERERKLMDRLQPETHEDVFLGRHKIISRYFTLYFKRVRKNSGARLRYLLVAEQHQDGWPHYHALIHERLDPVTKRQLECWPLGFTQFKLVDKFAVGYVTKYISKQALARIRASLKYGTGF